MSRPPIFIKDLKPEYNVWKLVVRVIDIWCVKERNGQQHLESIIQDAKGGQIHVITRSRDFDLWKNAIQEDNTYLVYNGEPLLNDLPLKVCVNDYKLFWSRSTTVTATELPDIPQHTFIFKSFKDFLSGDFVVDRLYDVIGVVQQVVRTQQPVAGKKACANLVLADASGCEMDLTLWESYATQFMSYNVDNGELVLILTHVWCRQSASSGKLNLSNAWNGSKLLLNFEHPQVDEFKTKYRFGDGNPYVDASQSRSINSCSQGTFDDRSFSFTKDVRSISDMLTLRDESFCNTIGKTVRFKSNPFGWYYEVCQKCNKTNQCMCAGKSNLITKYKIEIEVEHRSAVGNFVFWDKECIPIIGMPAHGLRQLMQQTNEDHPLIYPAHLDNLLGKKFAFRVKYQPFYKQGSVVRLTQDKDVWKQIKDAINPPNAADLTPLQEVDRKGKVAVSDEDTNTKNILTQTSNPTSNASVAQNWSPEPSYNNTPSKRSPEHVLIQEDEVSDILAPKQSSTKGARAKSARLNKTK